MELTIQFQACAHELVFCTPIQQHFYVLESRYVKKRDKNEQYEDIKVEKSTPCIRSTRRIQKYVIFRTGKTICEINFLWDQSDLFIRNFIII